MSADFAYRRILEAAADWISELQAAEAFLHGQSLRTLALGQIPTPQALPSDCLLADLPPAPTPSAQAFCHAVVAHQDFVAWKNDYTADQPGIDHAYLQRTGYFDLSGPNGPFVDATHRVMVGYWREGLDYPLHWHAAEEMYCIAAGRTLFAVDDNPLTLREPGTCIEHASQQPHRMRMDPDPLLALIIWRGQGLVDVANLE